jgi:hypothetical protein
MVEKLASLVMRTTDHLIVKVLILCTPIPKLLLSLHSGASVLYETYLRTVNFLMCFQSVITGEALLANIKVMWLFSGVSVPMSAQAVPVHETHLSSESRKYNCLPYCDNAGDPPGQMVSCIISRSPVRFTCKGDPSAEIHLISSH